MVTGLAYKNWATACQARYSYGKISTDPTPGTNYGGKNNPNIQINQLWGGEAKHWLNCIKITFVIGLRAYSNCQLHRQRKSGQLNCALHGGETCIVFVQEHIATTQDIMICNCTLALLLERAYSWLSFTSALTSAEWFLAVLLRQDTTVLKFLISSITCFNKQVNKVLEDQVTLGEWKVIL